MVFNRGTGHSQSVLAFKNSSGFGGLTVGILDGLGFVQNHIVEIDFGEFDNVGSKGAVGGHDQVEFAELGQHDLTIRAGVIQNTQFRGESGGLLNPVKHEAFWDDDQGRPFALAGLAPSGELGEHLYGLAKTHVVSQNASELELFEIIEPAKSFLLVRTKFALEHRGGFDWLDTFKRFKAFSNG